MCRALRAAVSNLWEPMFAAGPSSQIQACAALVAVVLGDCMQVALT